MYPMTYLLNRRQLDTSALPPSLPRHQLLQLVQRPWPVLAEQAAQRAIGQQLASGLAVDAVVGLVGGVADPLDLGAASRARLTITAMDRHARAKCRYFFRKLAGSFRAEVFYPQTQGFSRGQV